MKNPDSSPDSPDDAWDDLFRKRLADYTDQPPADALNRILAGAGQPRSRPYRRWAPVSFIMLLVLGIGGWLLVRQYNGQSSGVGVAHRIHSVAQTTRSTPETIPAGASVNRTTVPEPVVLSAPSPLLSPGRRAGLAVNRREQAAEILRWPRLADRFTKIHIADREPVVQSFYRRDRVAVTQTSDYGSNRQYRNLTQQNRQPEPSVLSNRARRHTGWNPVASVTLIATVGTESADYQAPSLLSAPSATRLQPVDLLTGRPFRALVSMATLPVVVASEPLAAPRMSRSQHRPSWFMNLTPLYNYQQINPIHTDAELVSDIRVAHPLATDRLGGRLQLGLDWSLADRLSLRTSLVYQQMRQSLRYAVQSTQPDSVRVVVVDAQSVQVTPIFSRQNYAETAIWHYVGISTDVVWQLNRSATNRWHHYLTAGATLGRYVSQGGAVNGFVQAAYGIERPLTTNLRLRVEPTLLVGWQVLTDQAKRFQNRPYSYGLSVGLRFR